MRSDQSNLTPMMQQYLAIRSELSSDTFLFFRLGDFYELFFEDAEKASVVMGITLTNRHGVPMAGVPYHSAEGYINKLLRTGSKVAICDQIEPAKAGKLVKREITRILTPGTTLEASQLIENQNQYLLAISISKKHIHAAWLDLSTGAFGIATDPNALNLLPVFNGLDPKEVLVPEIAYGMWKTNPELGQWWEQFESFMDGRPLSCLPDYQFDPINGVKLVMDSLGVLNLEGFGINREHPALGSAGALLAYATETLREAPKNIRSIKEYSSKETLLLDPSTLRNLEIFKSSQNTRSGTLIEAMDGTVTAAGGRLLDSYLAAPLIEPVELLRRQQCVADFIENPSDSRILQASLKKVRDLTRIISRLQNRIRNPRELGAIRDTLNQLPGLLKILVEMEGVAVKELASRVSSFDELREMLLISLNDELPSKLEDGGIIKGGYDKGLDYLLDLTTNNKTWISDLERAEQEKTGIKSLKVKFSGTFGYFIEITNSNLHLVPNHYIRKQTTTNSERFYTEELKEKEKEILTAEDRALAQEEKIFKQLVERTLLESNQLLKTAQALAEIDLFLGWAQIALEWNYCRPSLGDDDSLEIEQGRHPVVEQMLRKDLIGVAGSHSFVPNDTWLKSNSDQIALITGPNMAGKSTYIRQVALITLMAQVGSWVPADRCHIGLVDRIFSRVGASDELARGNSTFMVEMNETANIINNATARSLIILDEIGRGTSTYDGLSIAWAVVEHLHRNLNEGPRTLFATHYHELTKLDQTLTRLRNYCVCVKEWNEQIIFVRQVMPGAADRSYGIQVARLAGLPSSVIDRAKAILNELETEGNVIQEHLFKKKAKDLAKQKKAEKVESQLSFF